MRTPLKHLASLCFLLTLTASGYGTFTPEEILTGLAGCPNITTGIASQAVTNAIVPAKSSNAAFDALSLNYRIAKVILKSA